MPTRKQILIKEMLKKNNVNKEKLKKKMEVN